MSNKLSPEVPLANVQCIKFACEDLGLKGLTRIFFVVTGKVMMLAILAEKKKKKKLNERCVLCSAQKYQRSNLSLRMVIGIPGLGKFLLVESGIWEFFLTNPKSQALESRI